VKLWVTETRVRIKRFKFKSRRRFDIQRETIAIACPHRVIFDTKRDKSRRRATRSAGRCTSPARSGKSPTNAFSRYTVTNTPIGRGLRLSCAWRGLIHTDQYEPDTQLRSPNRTRTLSELVFTFGNKLRIGI